jgi:purine-binding chemotaxis protein CheW
MTTPLNNDSCLTYKIGQETFAASVNHVHEILEMRKITKIPHSPVFMKGVTNLRGIVLPVVDTRIKFGLPAAEPTLDTCIVVLNLMVNDNTVLVGALVDSVVEVFDAKEEDIKPLPPIGSKYDSDFIKGTVKVGEEFILFLDVHRVFTTDELMKVQDSAAVSQ